MTSLQLTSPAFPAGGAIPAAHTCEGADRSPALAWAGVPPGTRSLVLAIGMSWSHISRKMSGQLDTDTVG